MTRKAIFAAIKDARGGKSFDAMEVGAVDNILDALGVPRESDGPTPAHGPIALIDVSVLKAAAPEKADAELLPWVAPIRDVGQRYEINTIRRIAAFLTTLAHEGGFKIGVRENMNYSADRLAAVWPSRFKGPNALARSLHRKPEAIANEVYANRMGNGPPESGDGWQFRGNGPTQLTGRDNHQRFADAMGMTLDDATAWIGTIKGGVEAAAWFWEENDVNRLADTPGIADETKRINGGTIGLRDRTERFNRTVARLLELEK